MPTFSVTTPDQRADLSILAKTPGATISAGERHALAVLLADIDELEERAATAWGMVEAQDKAFMQAVDGLDNYEERLAAAEERVKELEALLRIFRRK